MPYPNTYRLITKYADKFINNTLTDDDIFALNQNGGKEFPRIPEHSPTEAMQDFIQTIGPLIPANTLHSITHRFLEIGAKFNEGENTFMRNTTLEKNLLAFELIHHPELGKKHFSKFPITDQFNDNEISYLQRVILSMPVLYFS